MFLEAHYKRNSVGDKVPNLEKKEELDKKPTAGEINQPNSLTRTPKGKSEPIIDAKK